MFIEISYPLREDSPKYPTSPKDLFESVTRIDDGFDNNTSTIHHHLHNGTHVDAPLHFSRVGAAIDAIPIEDFVYTSPFIVETRKGSGDLVTRTDIERHAAEIRNSDILFLSTGHDQLRSTDPSAYCSDFPSLAFEAAAFLRSDFPLLKAVCIDTLSIEGADSGPSRHFPVHKALLSKETSPKRPLLIYEDVHISRLLQVGRIVRVYAFPLRLCGLEASPVAMVAETI
jgi:arylformamidase